MNTIYIVFFATIIAFASSTAEGMPCSQQPVNIGGKSMCSCWALKGRCTRELNPVCDTSGKQYSNFCMMCYAVGQQLEKNPIPSIHFAFEGRCQQ